MTDKRIQILSEIEPILDHFGSRREDELSKQKVLAAYVSVLEGFSIEAVRLAVRDFMTGIVPGQSLEYRPKPAAMSSRARHHAIRLADASKRKERIKAQLAERLPPPSEPTAAQRAETVRKAMARFHTAETE